MHRRSFLAGLVTVAATPLVAEAQLAGKVPRVGMLMPVSSAAAAPNVEAFRQGLRERGYVEGQHVLIEYRYADGRVEPLTYFAAELVRLRVDVIVTWGTPAAFAAKRATRTIPIVMAAAGDPVATGLVSSLARPGGNVTGIANEPAELSGKTLELIKEVVPTSRHLAVLWNPDNPALGVLLRAVEAAAETLSVQLQILAVRDPRDFDAAFAAITRERAGAFLVLQDLAFFAHRDRIVGFAATNRLPVMYQRREYVDAGGLMSYGVNFRDNFRRAATFVDKILNGAKPADLPVEEPTKLELIVNLKTAKALGLTIPPSLLLRADQIIE